MSPTESALGRFPCTDCEKMFTSNRSLSNHSRSHKNKIKELFECDLCGSESGSRIKFNNHLKTHQDIGVDIKTEIEDQEPVENDWPVVDMEDDEDLNEDNFDEMVKLFKNQESQIKTEVPSDYGNPDLDIKVEGEDNHVQLDSLPFGWSRSLMKTETGEDNVLIAPEGRIFYSYVEALNYLMRDVGKMKKGLVEEGWEMNDNLPKGWYLKINKKDQLNYSFLTDTFDQLNSPQDAVDFMQKRGFYTQACIDGLSKYIKICEMSRDIKKEICDTTEIALDIKKEICDISDIKQERNDNIDLQTNIVLPNDINLYLQANKDGRKREITYADRKLPKGWQAGYLKNSSRVSFIAPNDKSFPCTRAALRYMFKQLYSSEDINTMAQNLKIDGWEKTEGGKWYSKNICTLENGKPNILYLSPEFRYFKTTKDALEYAEKQYTSDQAEFKNDLLERINAAKKRYKSVRYAWKAVDPTYPNGWKLRRVKESRTAYSAEGRNLTYFMAPDGATFSRVISALQYMVTKPYNESEFNAMIKLLNEDGYKTHENLPHGWYFKTNRGKNDRVWDPFFCSENFEIHRSTKAAVNYLKANQRYSNKDMENLSIFADEQANKLRKNKYEWLEGDGTLPKGWKIRKAEFSNWRYNKTYFLSPRGDSFSSLISALKHMKSENFPKEDISIMSKKLAKEGWKLDSRLPKGWRIRSIRNGSRAKVQQYLTETFQLLKSMRAVFELIDSNDKYSLTDFKHFAGENNEVLDKDNLGNILPLKETTEKRIEPPLEIKPENVETSEVEIKPEIKLEIKPENVETSEIEKNNSPSIDKKETPSIKPPIDAVTPDGKKFTSADAALRHMLSVGCSEIEMKIMREKLDEFGWKVDETLPKGWYKRYMKNGQRYGSESTRIFYLSPKYERFSSRRAVTEYLERESGVNEVEKPKQNIEANVDNTVPLGWKLELFEDKMYVISPKGNRFTSRVEALQYMINRNSPEESVEIMREALCFEDWLQNSHLPHGWRMHMGEKCSFLSREGKIFESVAKAAEFMIYNNLKYTPDDVTNLKMLQKDDDTKKFVEADSNNGNSDGKENEMKNVLQEENNKETTKTSDENIDELYQDIMLKLEDIPEEDLEKNPEEDCQERNNTGECLNEKSNEELMKENDVEHSMTEPSGKEIEETENKDSSELPEIKLEVTEEEMSNVESTNEVEETLEQQLSTGKDDSNKPQKRKPEEEEEAAEYPQEGLNKRVKVDEQVFPIGSKITPHIFIQAPLPPAYPNYPPKYPPYYQNSVYRTPHPAHLPANAPQLPPHPPQLPPHEPQLPPHPPQLPPHPPQLPPHAPQLPTHSPQLPPNATQLPPQVPPHAPQLPPHSPQLPPNAPQLPPQVPPHAPQLPPHSPQLPTHSPQVPTQVPPHAPQLPPHSPQLPTLSPRVPPHAPQLPPHAPQLPPHTPQQPSHSPQLPPQSLRLPPHAPQLPPHAPQLPPHSAQLPHHAPQVPPHPQLPSHAPQLPYNSYASYWPRYHAYPPYSRYPRAPAYPNSYHHPTQIPSSSNPSRMPYSSIPSKMPPGQGPSEIPFDHNRQKLPTGHNSGNLLSGHNSGNIQSGHNSGNLPSGQVAMNSGFQSTGMPTDQDKPFNSIGGILKETISEDFLSEKISGSDEQPDLSSNINA